MAANGARAPSPAAAAAGAAAPAATAGTRGPYVTRWCFTIHVGAEAAHNLDYLPPFDPDMMAYMVIGRETCPTTGRNHLQGMCPKHPFRETPKIGYVRFKAKKYARGVLTFLGGHAHLDKAKGNEEQNRTYCIKEGNYVEYGTFDAQAGVQGRRTDLHATVLRVQAGATMRELAQDPGHAENVIKHQAGIQALMNLVRIPPTERDIHTTVLWGPTGTGKSHRVFNSFPRDQIYMTKLANRNPWDGYTGQPVLFLDEFAPSQVTVQDLNTFLDKWPVMLPSRYFDKPAFWTTVVIAANSNPMEWYRGGLYSNPLEADSLLRRITEPMGRIYYVETREQEVDMHWATPPPPPPAPPSTPSTQPRPTRPSTSPPPTQLDPNPRPLKRSRAQPHLRAFFGESHTGASTATAAGSSRSPTTGGRASTAAPPSIIDLTGDDADTEDAQMLGNLDEEESQAQ